MTIDNLMDTLSTYPDKFFITTEDLADDIKEELLNIKKLLQVEFNNILFRLQSLYTVTNSSISTKNNIVNNLLETNRISSIIRDDDIKFFNSGVIPSVTNAIIASFFKLYSEIPILMKDKSFIDASDELSIELRTYMANTIQWYSNKWNEEYRFTFYQNRNTSDTIDRIRNEEIKESLNTITTISKNGSIGIKSVIDEVMKIKNTWVETLIGDTIRRIDYLKHRSNGEFLNKDYSTIASNVILTTFILSHCIIELVNMYCDNISEYNQEIMSYLDKLKGSREV